MKRNSVSVANSKELEKEIAKAITFYREFHWGIESDKANEIKFPILNQSIKCPHCGNIFESDNAEVEVIEPVVEIGKFRGVVYETAKGDMKKPEFFFHSFKMPFPILATTANGKGLFTSMGCFSIKENGIND